MDGEKVEHIIFFRSSIRIVGKRLKEYTNGLIRQYIPKKVNFINYSDDDIEKFQKKLIEDQENCLILKILKISSFISLILVLC